MNVKMAKLNLFELDIQKLFEDRSIVDIIEINKLLDLEIDKKRIELRSMVGDRYKDILTATDAINSMETMSEIIVTNLQTANEKCDLLLSNTSLKVPAKPLVIEQFKIEERAILVQIRLAIEIEECLWRSIDERDYCKAAQLYLLAQHMYTGLTLSNKNILYKYRLIRKLKATIDTIRDDILEGANNILQKVELNTEDTCRKLCALMLLKNYTASELFHKFIELRKDALNTVIDNTHSTVRAKISAMIKCLCTTIQLLHDCFLNYNQSMIGLIWHQLDDIIKDDSATTLSKMFLPTTNIMVYMPDLISDYRPKCSNGNSNISKLESINMIQQLLKDTSEIIENGLLDTLELVINVKGLHLIRDEAQKIEMPENWTELCKHMELPKNFNIWSYFFQSYITARAECLIVHKISMNTSHVETILTNAITTSAEIERLENDLRFYIWQEDTGDKSNMKLSMKTQGYSPTIVKLADEMDIKYFELLDDIFLYMYGKEYAKNNEFPVRLDIKYHETDKKYHDRTKLENHLKMECASNITKLIMVAEKFVSARKGNTNFIVQSIMCARFFNSLTMLCPNFKMCCCCNISNEDWGKIGGQLQEICLKFWTNWINDCNLKTQVKCEELFGDIGTLNMLSFLCRWDSIEIQEQTDEKTFKSQIKIPMKISMSLQKVLDYICELINSILPHTLPKQVHLKYIESNMLLLLNNYEMLLEKNINQTQALQLLFDVKFITSFCIPRENMTSIQKSQDICDKLRSFVDPFDLDVFYKYVQNNVKQNVLQSQVIFGSLLPSSDQHSNLGVPKKSKEQEKEPSILALSSPATNNWFMLLPVTAPGPKTAHSLIVLQPDKLPKKEVAVKKTTDVRSGAAALFGAMTTDWFS